MRLSTSDMAQCTNTNANLPEVTDFGYHASDDDKNLLPTMTLRSCAAPESVNDILCNCNGICDDQCCCSQNNQACTADCSCAGEVEWFDETDDVTICMNAKTLLWCEDEEL